jgi:hypothetical protein
MTYEELDAAEVYFISQLKTAMRPRPGGMPTEAPKHIKLAIELIRKQRKCRQGHKAGE